MFAPPSAEALRLLRWFPDLLSPADGRGSLVSRLVRMALVAPNTQLTVLSFELQAFLFDVFHLRAVSRLGHAAFMTTCNFFAMLLFAQWYAGDAPPHWFGASGAWVYAGLLVVWYTAVAASQKLWAWAAVMVPIVAALACGATHCLALLQTPQSTWGAPLPLWINPWLGMAGSALLIAVSHAPEPRLPPRAADPLVWQSIPEFLLKPGLTLAQRLSRAVRIALFLVWGTLDEWWASPRLMAYNYLMLMLQGGYAPQVRARLADWKARALASGNPAIDYVGIGGGTFLGWQPDEERP